MYINIHFKAMITLGNAITGGDDVKACFKLCIGNYQPGNMKCNDGTNHRVLDCELKPENRMDVAALRELFPKRKDFSVLTELIP